ncbi:hypothetical protein GOP47_0017582 [Adiantum capillus-veneris]|uniref:Uncharacterized protein n=1 Tax=Adiantum capillus-veneris TaxID=13818 RepID=A0A9D4UFN3_ADICA|nr:hypothetical protein GOP47_0017582 [Adiantum capillus-veneris]
MAVSTAFTRVPACSSSVYTHTHTHILYLLKFREFLAEELGKYDSLSDACGRIAEVCAKALHNYGSTYSGGIDAKPVEDMKTALVEQGNQEFVCCVIKPPICEQDRGRFFVRSRASDMVY